MKTTQFGGCIDPSNCEGLVGAGGAYGEKRKQKKQDEKQIFDFLGC